STRRPACSSSTSASRPRPWPPIRPRTSSGPRRRSTRAPTRAGATTAPTSPSGSASRRATWRRWYGRSDGRAASGPRIPSRALGLRCRVRIAVSGHVEHVILGRVPAVPAAGGIAHLEAPVWLAGGGGGLAFAQLARSTADLHFFTAIGDDEAGAQVAARLAA